MSVYIQEAVSDNSSKKRFDLLGYPTNDSRDKFLEKIMINGRLPENVELLSDGRVRWTMAKVEGGRFSEYGVPPSLK